MTCSPDVPRAHLVLGLQGLYPRKLPSPGQIRMIDPRRLLFSVGSSLLWGVEGSENSPESGGDVYLTACVIHSSRGHLAPDTTTPPGARCDHPPKPWITRAYSFLFSGGLSQETLFLFLGSASFRMCQCLVTGLRSVTSAGEMLS